eukprot:Nitzschia sp. Nitz4//scaffold71_size96697//58901//60627//NITZ4_004700-RA/size96697-processed-gene-0.114-mRNA-1//1//CDS//3329557262//4684//frame0
MTLGLLLLAVVGVYGVSVEPRHCRGNVKHLHLSVGKDPATSMTISWASKWSLPDVEAPIGGVHFGTSPNDLDRFVGEQETPLTYVSTLHHHEDQFYYAPFQHHITLDGLEPDTTYYYVAVLGDRSEGIQALKDTPLRDHPTQHIGENLTAENEVIYAQQELEEGLEDGLRRKKRLRRALGPAPYDGHDKKCLEGHKVRSFKTAPLPKNPLDPQSQHAKTIFAIIGDLGQFPHSQETLEHMRDNRDGIDAVHLVGDIAYTEYDHRRWDTFFDFLDDYSVFSEIPLQVAIGNHDIDKQENGKEIFQAYESRFRMPQVHPAELGTYDGPPGLLNMDNPPYPLPYEWGNAYYEFDYGPSKHIVVNAYSAMEPGSTQYEWIQSVLKSVNRDITPWVFVSIHVPLYNTFSLHPHDSQIFAAREHLEPLFVKYHVNVVFTGHIHAYQRTANVDNDTIVETGPIHITVGAGGRQCDAPFKSEDAEPWLIKRDASYYGYGRITLFNETHAEWKWIHLSASDLHDYNVVKNEEVHMAQLDHDKIIIDNQFYVAQRKV